jgi:hypothetical protein
MPTPIQDKLRTAMTTGGTLTVDFSSDLNAKAAGRLDVFLHDLGTSIRIDLVNTGEPANILWLPWKQGNLTELQPSSITGAAVNSLFFTYYLSGCKVFGVRGGPVWHIDAPVTVAEFWPRIASDEWVEDYWPVGDTEDVAYIHRAGQQTNLWDLSTHLSGAAPTTYGSGNVGQAIVGGVVNASKQIDFYFQASPWARLPYGKQTRKS